MIEHMNAVQPTTRRGMLRDSACGFGMLALGSLFERNLAMAANVEFDPANPLAVREPHFQPRREAGDLPVHARRPLVGGHLRAQALPGAAPRRAAADRAAAGFR